MHKIDRFLIASGNAHKIDEIKKIALQYGLDIEFMYGSKYPEPDFKEFGKTFEENAIIKAKAFYNEYKIPIISDDSGLCVQKLGGDPGIYSSRYSGKGTQGNIDKLLLELSGASKEDRKAWFHSTACLMFEEDAFLLFNGRIDGIIIDEMRGENGFGYDPVFYLPEYKKTMAQLPEEKKNSISHRHNAFTRLFSYLSKGHKR